jgi:hypothetical protein
MSELRLVSLGGRPRMATTAPRSRGRFRGACQPSAPRRLLQSSPSLSGRVVAARREVPSVPPTHIVGLTSRIAARHLLYIGVAPRMTLRQTTPWAVRAVGVAGSASAAPVKRAAALDGHVVAFRGHQRTRQCWRWPACGPQVPTHDPDPRRRDELQDRELRVADQQQHAVEDHGHGASRVGKRLEPASLPARSVTADSTLPGSALRTAAAACTSACQRVCRRRTERARHSPAVPIWLAYKGERRDSNPRPPGPQPDRSTSRGLCNAWLRDAGCSQFAWVTLV